MNNATKEKAFELAETISLNWLKDEITFELYGKFHPIVDLRYAYGAICNEIGCNPWDLDSETRKGIDAILYSREKEYQRKARGEV